MPYPPRPKLSYEFIGEELAIFWVNPYPLTEGGPLGTKEKIATFWWPFHPAEKTKEVETLFEDMAALLVQHWNEGVPL